MVTLTAPHIQSWFVDRWIIKYGTPRHMLMDNFTQVFSRFLKTLCVPLGTKHLTTTAYHPRTNGTTERLNMKINARLRHYGAEHRRDKEIYVLPLTNANNVQERCYTSVTPSSLVLTQHHIGPTTFSAWKALPNDATTIKSLRTFKNDCSTPR